MIGRKIVVALALLVMTLTPLCASAQPGAPAGRDWLRSESHRQGNSTSASSRSGLGRGLVALVLVGAGAYLVWRKTRHSRQSPLPTKTHIRVVGGTIVGPKARAVVADVGGRLILLGVTEQSVRKLAWLDNIDGIGSSDEREDDESEREERTSHRANEPLTRLAPRQKTPTRSGPQRSSFSDVLKDAVGIKARPATDSALVLAENTQDRVNLSHARAQSRREPQLIDIEGQAAGLVSRLSKAKQ